jgi:endonuclease/exonuclease/phosphatase family metal-dependent hydrolase
MTSSLRRSLPISTSLTKILDLDRCYSVTRIPVENGKELLLYNVHASAYGSDDSIRTAQMTMLFEDMQSEYEKGNYVICGGDFNHDFTGDSTQKLNGGAEVDFGWAQPFPMNLLPDCIERCDGYTELVPTCRNCDIPYKAGNFTIIVDGFLVTKNVEVSSVENINTEFVYSDHNPVVLEFALK